MKISIILFLLIIVSLFEHNSTFHFYNGLIYNGAIFNIKDYPYAMFIRFWSPETGYTSCTGSLVRKKFVLTAGHCCYETNMTETEVYQGSPLVENPQIRNVVEIHIPKDYDPKKNGQIMKGDICVIKLKEEFKHIKKYLKIGGSPKDFDKGKKLSCKMIGFGQTGNAERNGKTGYIMTNDVVYGRYACKLANHSMIKTSWDQYLCLIPKGDASPCKGDSGGPMICNNKQYGVCSFGYPYGDGISLDCGQPELQQIYTFAHYYKEWLFNIIGPDKKKKRSSGNLLKPHQATLNIILSILLYNIMLTFI